MTEKLKQTIKDEVEKLPKEMQDAINSLDWVTIVKEIGKKHFLTGGENDNALLVETLLILVGVENLDSYALNIENNIGTSRNEAERIVKEVEEQILTPIYNLVTEKVKKSITSKDPQWKNIIDFVLSGGDYSKFMTSILEKAEKKEDGAINSETKTGEHPSP